MGGSSTRPLSSCNSSPNVSCAIKVIDVFQEQWNTPYPESPNELPDQRRKRLVRQWLNLGTMGREPYYSRTRKESQTYAPVQPTQQQIDAILRPLRPDSLRRYAAGYKAWTGAEGMWIRTNYDAENEEAHQILWNKYVDISQVIGPDSLVLEDEGLFANADIARVLERFPERVTNYSAPEDVEWREKELADFLQMREEAEGENAGTREEKSSLSSDDLCRTYWMYHAACVVTHAFIEDAEAQGGGGVLHVFLDDCGNVVRQVRVNSDEVDNFDGAWFEGSWKDGWVYPGELGRAYLPGGVRGPPYR
ncbi:unnamed protein product [Penicillium nalgiovense]|nr:unnamed protein product [Penicillium nalgiovense]CAG8076351.1 unnamed protein product [Penicillium nalgiovense]CAG8092817.1 unnamed protein product [Penicillium nalgiovense]CAG8103979.1 unnamed protein product [Penicillium nalgiovense]CAH0466605.1 unnamed protein product [Penicillium nalgiovense]